MSYIHKFQLTFAVLLAFASGSSRADGFWDGVMQVLGAEFARGVIEVIKSQNSSPSVSSNSYSPPTKATREKTLASKASIHYETYWNARFGFKIQYPSELLNARGESENGDGQIFISNNGKTALVAYGNFATLID